MDSDTTTPLSSLQHRFDFMNFFIERKKYKKYLELGACGSYNFNEIRCQTKISVDCNPETHPTFLMTTDDFFKKMDTDLAETATSKFDIIFIDAEHEDQQVARDIANSLKYLNKGGLIITHDTLPVHYEQTKLGGSSTAYMAFARLRATDKNLHMCSLDFANENVSEGIGIGLIARGTQNLYPVNIDTFAGHAAPADSLDPNPDVVPPVGPQYEPPPKWDFYVNNKKDLMNIIGLDELEEWLDEI